MREEVGRERRGERSEKCILEATQRPLPTSMTPKTAQSFLYMVIQIFQYIGILLFLSTINTGSVRSKILSVLCLVYNRHSINIVELN